MRRAAALIALAVLACGSRQSTGSGVNPDDAIFYIKTNVSDAAVFVDGRYVGPIAILKGGIAVSPGKHRVEVRRDDYFSRYAELDLHRAERKQLELQLAPVLP